VDLDGHVDVLVAACDADHVTLIRGLGGGGFAAPERLPGLLDSSCEVEAADLDGDGDPDVVATAFYADRLVWIENTGGSWAQPRTISSAVDGAISATIDDLNGDGLPDVVAAAAYSDTVAWYKGWCR
jgi:hypothetical protein